VITNYVCDNRLLWVLTRFFTLVVAIYLSSASFSFAQSVSFAPAIQFAVGTNPLTPKTKPTNGCNSKRRKTRDRWSSPGPVSVGLLNSCLSRVSAWPVPAHWSKRDWFEEMRAHIESAAWHAVCDYDPSRNVPLPAFVYRRVIASSLTRYRQEWSYTLHSVCQADEEKLERASIAHDSLYSPGGSELLRYALVRLTEPQRQLIRRLFWDGYTETEVAQSLGISHQAVSRRKRAVLQLISARLK
jgi:RNA polymerase sigma factor (sigma-70 family)